MKHTPGNWHTHDGQIYPEETGKTLALVPYYDKDDNEQEANAKLIAAAPDLLKALCGLIDNIEFSKKDIPPGFIGNRQIRSAINAIQKATL